MAVPGGGPPVTPGYPMAPKIRFDAISEAWGLLQQQLGTYVLAMLLMFAIMVVAGIIGRIIPVLGPLIAMLVFLAAGPVLAGGLYRMAMRQMRGESIAPGDVLSATDLVVQLAIAGLLSGLATEIASIFCVIPGFIVGGLLMFTIPLVADRNMGALDAMSLSWNTLKSDIVMAAVFYFVITLVAMVGILACGVGVLITGPLALLSIAVLYRDYFGGTTTATAYPVPTPPVDTTPPSPPAV